MHACMHAWYICMSVCVSVCLYVSLSVCMHVRVCVSNCPDSLLLHGAGGHFARAHTHTHSDTHTHKHKHKHTHTHKHTTSGSVGRNGRGISSTTSRTTPTGSRPCPRAMAAVAGGEGICIIRRGKIHCVLMGRGWPCVDI